MSEINSSSNSQPKLTKPQASVSDKKIPDTIELGKIVGVWGVKGWLKIFSYTRNRQDIGQYAEWLLVPQRLKSPKNASDWQSVQVKHCRTQGQNIVAQLDGVDDRDQAHAMIGQKIFIQRSQLPNLPEGQYYWMQLIGLDVVTTQGEALGTVTSMLETGANDVFVVTDSPENDKQERLIPNIDEVVAEVDLTTNTLTVDWDKDFLIKD